jgi:putative ABC transport system permease protein
MRVGQKAKIHVDSNGRTLKGHVDSIAGATGPLMLLRKALVVISAGIVIGGAGSLAFARVLAKFLFEVKPSDPATFAAVALVLAISALAACYIPARRATGVDPLVALRYE